MGGRRLPRDWTRTQLGTTASVNRGVTWSREQETQRQVTGGMPVVRIANVQVSGFRMNETLFIQGVPDGEQKRKTISPRTIVMVGSNGNRDRVGNAFLATEEVTGHLYASFLIGIEPSGDVSERFLTSWLRSAAVQSRITEATAGSTGLKNLSLSWLRGLNVDLPPLPEQRAIAAVLDAIDNAIERTEAVIAATGRLRDALLHELLTRGVPGRHSEWKQAPGLGTIPACWDVVRLGDVFDVLDARRIPLNADERAKMTGSYPYYGANGVVDHINQWIFDEDDDLVLLAEDGGHFDEFLTRPIAYRVRGRCWVNNHAHVLQATDGSLTSFLFRSLVNKDIRPFINGTTRSKLTQGDLRRIEIGTPPSSDEAHLIGGTLDGIQRSTDSLQDELVKLVNVKTATADALLSGRVRVAIQVSS